MSRNEFWSHIEQCRSQADGMPAFNRRLEAILDDWELPKLGAFHKAMWCNIGVQPGEDLLDLMYEVAEHVGVDEGYGYAGWLIAQGRDFHEAVMRDERVALTRIPSQEDVHEGESVTWASTRVCVKKTGGRYGPNDLFGDDLSGRPRPGVDFPVTW
jgi:hypothetical protein